MSNFNGWAISEELFAWIRANLPAGSIILELGSGKGTIELCRHYTVFSIEHDENWLNKAPSTYIHAPIKNGWYDVDVLRKELPVNYNLILVDGPPGFIGREKFLDNLGLFNTGVSIIFDDTHRPAEHALAVNTARALKAGYKEYVARKSFIVIRN